MSYNNQAFVDAINSSNLFISEGKVVVFDKNGSVTRATAEGEVKLKNHTLFSDDISYVENGSAKTVDLSMVKSINGINYEDFKN